MAEDEIYYWSATTGSTLAIPIEYTGTGYYASIIYDGYIKVDKGSLDKASFVIFYAILEQTDPMIFCKTEKELKRELAKLLKREDVDQESIRVFTLTGVVRKIK
jgi:hypothetical protein